ncbi:COG1470 family protein [Paenibacillus mendelii]|uniref:Sugar-binding domain-containing protein n=1 Tax=Paenibacillus mendelii TaxID=206163 RepID=A0ABV6J5J3_9BACL|nr:sugar-binding domain-containing protein [Paenibacillus mendelii]MCQ6560478.1 hypothetical protein [Paenibacillus mendelii]
MWKPIGSLALAAIVTAAALVPVAGPVRTASATADVLEFAPGDAAEQALLIENDGAIQEHGTYFRFTDGWSHLTYKLTKPLNSKALLTLTLASQYLVRVSTDNATWTDVLDYEVNGNFKEDRTIDLSPYFAQSPDVYVRLEDKVKTDGWGGQIWRAKLQTYDLGTSAADLQADLSDGWSVSVDQGPPQTIQTGDPIAIAAGSTASYTRTFQVPDGWPALPIRLAFSGVTGEATVYVNGAPTGVGKEEHMPFTVPVATSDLQSGQLDIRVDVQREPGAVGSGDLGLWRTVKAGHEDLFTIPEPVRTFGSEQVKLEKQYAPYDLTELNWLGANALQSLYDDRYGLLNFDGYMRNKELHYVHDSLRAIGAFYEEERYSPVVRLDLVKKLYNGVKAAKVPGSDYEFFLKHDKRPKKIRGSFTVPADLQFEADQDLNEPIGNIGFRVRQGNGTELASKELSYSDGTIGYAGGQYDFTRTYANATGTANVAAAVRYWDGDADKPSQVTFSATGDVSALTAVVDDFDQRWQGRSYALAEKPDRTTASASNGDFVIDNPQERYILLRTNPDWWVKSILVTWDGHPSQVKLKATNGVFTSVEITYPSASNPVTLKAVPFEWFDPNMNWPHAAAANILQTGHYGAGGFDPTYSVDIEGLGPYGLATAAYILKKYGDPHANEAVALAKLAVDGAYEAELTRPARTSILHGLMVASEALMRAGYPTYETQFRHWADRILAEQQSDGSWVWLDMQTRNMVTMLHAYNQLGDAKYLQSYNDARGTIQYSPQGLVWKGQVNVGSPLPLYGAPDIAFLAHRNDPALADVMSAVGHYFGDTGLCGCSDINPYFLGFSLKNAGLTDGLGDTRYPLKLWEYAKYDAGGMTVLLNPTAYVNNPYYPAEERNRGLTLLGERNLGGWLTQVDVPDGGATQPAGIVQGESARSTRPQDGQHAIYFDVDDRFLHDLDKEKGKDKDKVVVTVRYLDEGHDSWTLEFDAGRGNDSFKVKKNGTNRWTEKSFVLPHARFAGGLNGHDFRIRDNGGETVTISRVEVRLK